MTELRTGALEDRALTLLELGRAAEALPGLEALVARHPSRERPAVALMRALYAVGRQADALAAYHDLRARLDDELGVEPADEARALYRRILVHDPALSTAPPKGNLPRRASGLVGRGRGDRARRRCAPGGAAGDPDRRRRAGSPGSPWRWQPGDRARFADGVWLCELAGLPDGSPIDHAVAAALGIQQRSGLSIEQTVIEYLRGRALLLVVDNCEHVLASAARLVSRIVEHCPAVTVLATSREALAVDGEQQWPVPPLPVDDAVALFVQRARAVSPDFRLDRANAEPSRRSALASTDCRWVSSSPRRGCGR